MRYWWVNQNQTYKSEVPGGFLWSPRTRSDGARNQFYDNMREVKAGDVVFSFCDTRVKAIGIAVGGAQTASKPDFGGAGSNWSREGWLVPVEFTELTSQPRPKDHIGDLRPYLPEKYSPLQSNGDGLQSVYLAEVPGAMAEVLIAILGHEYVEALDTLRAGSRTDDAAEDLQEEAIRGRTDISVTTKEQLVKARRGQGVFKANVRLNESGCRVTGVTDPRHLRASHIKPWKDSTDQEKLDGCNGLLLAPHVDHLFDTGLISFSNGGDLLVSKDLDPSILERWGVPAVLCVGAFRPEQTHYLEHHRQNVFKGELE